MIARTGHERYRWLTSEANPDEWSREGYRRHVLAMAGSPEPPPAPDATHPTVPLADAMAAMKLGWKSCLYAEHGPGCGCAGVKCWAWDGPRVIALRECVSCLKGG